MNWNFTIISAKFGFKWEFKLKQEVLGRTNITKII